MTRQGVIESVAVVGLGKVGELVGTLLHQAGFTVVGIDRRAPDGVPFDVRSVDAGDVDGLAEVAADVDAVVACLPFHLNRHVAEAAARGRAHYFDLTEDIATTERVKHLAADAANSSTAFAPQCGLAPGLIGIIGASVAAQFDDGGVRSIQLRVGSLPQHPTGLLGYAFIWSPEGVVNEYLNDCEVLRDGKRRLVPPMQELETVVIDGTRLEAFTTSGGLATMCETYEGLVDRLDYKTLRYPGHCDLMRFVFDELLLRDRRELAGEILVNAKPPVDDDVVYLYVAVEGRQRGEMVRRQFVRKWLPKEIDGRRWRAISWTTACSAAAVVELVASGELPAKGLIRQETIPFDALLATRSGAFLAG